MKISGFHDKFCQIFVVRSKTLSLVLFILIAIVLEFVVHHELKISVVYTHLFYLVIVIAAIWYQQKVVWLALFFGILHIAVTYLIEGTVSLDSLFRAIMLCVIAYIVGSLVRCLNRFREEEIRQKHELEKAQGAFQTANKKLNILSSITRHDILNQLTALVGYLDIGRDLCDDPELLAIMKKEYTAAGMIQKQIEFTRHYQDIGIKAPVWHDLDAVIQNLHTIFHHDTISLVTPWMNLELYADPLFPLICENLIDNSIRHGDHVRTIQFDHKKSEHELILLYTDDGAGVPDHEKEKIFERGYGKHTGMGLFLTQEILAITGLSMRETGLYGKGVRFEIHVPEGSFRVKAKS